MKPPIFIIIFSIFLNIFLALLFIIIFLPSGVFWWISLGLFLLFNISLMLGAIGKKWALGGYIGSVILSSIWIAYIINGILGVSGIGTLWEIIKDMLEWEIGKFLFIAGVLGVVYGGMLWAWIKWKNASLEEGKKGGLLVRVFLPLFVIVGGLGAFRVMYYTQTPEIFPIPNDLGANIPYPVEPIADEENLFFTLVDLGVYNDLSLDNPFNYIYEENNTQKFNLMSYYLISDDEGINTNSNLFKGLDIPPIDIETQTPHQYAQKYIDKIISFGNEDQIKQSINNIITTYSKLKYQTPSNTLYKYSLGGTHDFFRDINRYIFTLFYTQKTSQAVQLLYSTIEMQKHMIEGSTDTLDTLHILSGGKILTTSITGFVNTFSLSKSQRLLLHNSIASFPSTKDLLIQTQTLEILSAPKNYDIDTFWDGELNIEYGENPLPEIQKYKNKYNQYINHSTLFAPTDLHKQYIQGILYDNMINNGTPSASVQKVYQRSSKKIFQQHVFNALMYNAMLTTNSVYERAEQFDAEIAELLDLLSQ